MAKVRDVTDLAITNTLVLAEQDGCSRCCRQTDAAHECCVDVILEDVPKTSLTLIINLNRMFLRNANPHLIVELVTPAVVKERPIDSRHDDCGVCADDQQTPLQLAPALQSLPHRVASSRNGKEAAVHVYVIPVSGHVVVVDHDDDRTDVVDVAVLVSRAVVHHDGFACRRSHRQ